MLCNQYSLIVNNYVKLYKTIISGLSRVPVLNSFARTPPIVWKMGWFPTPSGEPKTRLPPLPIDLMLDKEVLREFVHRINVIGMAQNYMGVGDTAFQKLI